MTRRPLNDKGVSVIIGTLLLILITVTAAAALALMISQMQKEEATRQSQLQAVHDEDVVISGLSFVNNVTLWDSTYPNQPFDISNSQNWSSVTFNLMNLNTQNVNVAGIAINNYYAYPINYTLLAPPSSPTGYCNLTAGGVAMGGSGGPCTVFGSDAYLPYLTIPAGSSVQVTVNLTSSLTDFSGSPFGDTPSFIGTGSQIDIKILTSLTNIFEQTYKPPTPVIIYNTQTTTIGSVQQDSIVLDGSQSSSVNATIVNWTWTFVNATNTWPTNGNCSDIKDLGPVSNLPINFYSKIVHISPPVPGPFCANLTVTDSNGMVATTSQDQLIPANTQFTPAANLIATYNPPFINVTILDINGNPVNNTAVNYVIDINQFGNLTLTNYEGATNGQGMNSTNVTCGTGSIKVISGQLPSSEVAVSSMYQPPC